MVNILCCNEWNNILCIIVSVVVGFLHILYDKLLSVFCIVMSTKFILLFCSSMINCRFGWMVLNSCSVRFMSASFSLQINRLFPEFVP
jgi:hypothetical protein